jgi:hypothetical protein
MTLDLEWNRQSSGDEQFRMDRFPLMRAVNYERTEALSEAGGLEGREGFDGMALSINVGSGGMCLLMDWGPQRQEVLRVHVPMPITLIKTPTLAEVCWKRPVPLSSDSLYFVGLRFVL